MRQIHRHALALGLVLALSACGGDPEPQFEADPSPAPSEVTSSAPAKEAWEEKSPEGAVAFAEHWTATFSEAFQTGETADFSRLNDVDCESCAFLTETVNDIYADGGTATGDPWRLRKPAWAPPSDNERRIVVTGLMEIPALVIRRPGERPDREEPTTARFNFHLAWAAGWRVEKLVRQT